MATHSSILAWRIPGTGEPGGLLSLGSHRVGHDWSDLAAAALGQHFFPLKNKNLHIYYSRDAAAAAAKSLQSWPTLCDPIDSSPPGSAVPGILQARTLEWVAISFSNAIAFSEYSMRPIQNAITEIYVKECSAYVFPQEFYSI